MLPSSLSSIQETALSVRDVDFLGDRGNLEDSKLWQLEGQSYDQWVCGLADALLSHACNPLLTILQRCACKKPAIAELLLPHIFVDLAANDADASLMLTISEQASMSIVSPDLCTHSSKTRPGLTAKVHGCGSF